MYLKVKKEGLDIKIDYIIDALSKHGSITYNELKSILNWDSIDLESVYDGDAFGWTAKQLSRKYIVRIDGYINEDLETALLSIPAPNRLCDETLKKVDSKMDDTGKRISYGKDKAVREPMDGKGRFDLITPFGLARLARWYELGSKKYSDRNWEKGMPFSRYICSAIRHINKYIMGMTDEDHLAAAVWNILAIIHHEELGQTNLDDMPHYLTPHAMETTEVKEEAE